MLSALIPLAASSAAAPKRVVLVSARPRPEALDPEVRKAFEVLGYLDAKDDDAEQ